MEPSDEPSGLLEALRVTGLRVTGLRMSVLSAVRQNRHATADALSLQVRNTLGSVSTQAVYNVLGAFVEADLVRRIEPAGSAARYEARIGDNHHHLVCRTCSTVEDVDCVVGAAPCLTPLEDSGFVIDEAEVIFWGLCPVCQANQNSLPNSPKNEKEQQI